MKRTIGRIRPLAPAVAAVLGSVFVSLYVLQPPTERLLPGATPADRGHTGALVLPAPRAPRPAAHPQQALPPAAPVATVHFIPTRQPLTPPAHHSTKPAPTHARKPKSKPKSKPVTPPPPTPTPTPTPPTVPTPPPPPPVQTVALARKAHGPSPHSNSRLLGHPKKKPEPKPQLEPKAPTPPKAPQPPKPPKPPKPPHVPAQPSTPTPPTPPQSNGNAGAPPGQAAGGPPGQEKDKGSPKH
jgi:hypothetical protein